MKNFRRLLLCALASVCLIAAAEHDRSPTAGFRRVVPPQTLRGQLKLLAQPRDWVLPVLVVSGPNGEVREYPILSVGPGCNGDLQKRRGGEWLEVTGALEQGWIKCEGIRESEPGPRPARARTELGFEFQRVNEHELRAAGVTDPAKLGESWMDGHGRIWGDLLVDDTGKPRAMTHFEAEKACRDLGAELPSEVAVFGLLREMQTRQRLRSRNPIPELYPDQWKLEEGRESAPDYLPAILPNFGFQPGQADIHPVAFWMAVPEGAPARPSEARVFLTSGGDATPAFSARDRFSTQFVRCVVPPGGHAPHEAPAASPPLSGESLLSVFEGERQSSKDASQYILKNGEKFPMFDGDAFHSAGVSLSLFREADSEYPGYRKYTLRMSLAVPPNGIWAGQVLTPIAGTYYVSGNRLYRAAGRPPSLEHMGSAENNVITLFRERGAPVILRLQDDQRLFDFEGLNNRSSSGARYVGALVGGAEWTRYYPKRRAEAARRNAEAHEKDILSYTSHDLVTRRAERIEDAFRPGRMFKSTEDWYFSAGDLSHHLKGPISSCEATFLNPDPWYSGYRLKNSYPTTYKVPVGTSLRVRSRTTSETEADMVLADNDENLFHLRCTVGHRAPNSVGMAPWLVPEEAPQIRTVITRHESPPKHWDRWRGNPPPEKRAPMLAPDSRWPDLFVRGDGLIFELTRGQEPLRQITVDDKNRLLGFAIEHPVDEASLTPEQKSRYGLYRQARAYLDMRAGRTMSDAEALATYRQDPRYYEVTGTFSRGRALHRLTRIANRSTAMEDEWRERTSAATALGHFPRETDFVMPGLIEALREPYLENFPPEGSDFFKFREAVTRSLAGYGTAAGPRLRTATHDKNRFVRGGAADALAAGTALPLEETIDLLGELATKDADPGVRKRAIQGLARLRPRAAEKGRKVSFLEKALSDGEESVRQLASHALRAVAGRGPARAIDERLWRNQSHLTTILKTSSDPRARARAAGALAEHAEDSSAAISTLLEALADKNDNVQAAIVKALGRFGERARPLVESALRNRGYKNFPVRFGLLSVLEAASVYSPEESADRLAALAKEDPAFGIRNTVPAKLARVRGLSDERRRARLERLLELHDAYGEFPRRVKAALGTLPPEPKSQSAESTSPSRDASAPATQQNEGVVFAHEGISYWAPKPGARATLRYDGRTWVAIASTTEPGPGVTFRSGGYLYWAPAPGRYATHVWSHAGWMALGR